MPFGSCYCVRHCLDGTLLSETHYLVPAFKSYFQLSPMNVRAAKVVSLVLCHRQSAQRVNSWTQGREATKHSKSKR